MSWYTSKLGIGLRSVARSLGLTKLVRQLGFRSRVYEERFDQVMLRRTTLGDCVWDVGANVGLYTLKFLDRCGEAGQVIAFEPSAENAMRLREAVAKAPNVTIRQEALGNENGERNLVQGDDALGATSFVSAERAGGVGVPIQVARGDALIAQRMIPPPTVLKIDTEGFELEVLFGLTDTLKRPELHTLGIEVHFALLARRDQADAPRKIERLLNEAGFESKWVDASHIVGMRADGRDQS